MTRIIVTPIDMAAPRSYRERVRLMRAYATVMGMAKATTPDGVIAAVRAQEDLDALIIAHAETEDGSPLEAALDEISNDDFTALYAAIMGGETVPNPSDAS